MQTNLEGFLSILINSKVMSGWGGGELGLWTPCLLNWSQECEDLYAEFDEVESPTLSTVVEK